MIFHTILMFKTTYSPYTATIVTSIWVTSGCPTESHRTRMGPTERVRHSSANALILRHGHCQGLLHTAMSAPRKSSITILYFAAASTATGMTREEVELPPSDSDVGAEPSKNFIVSHPTRTELFLYRLATLRARGSTSHKASEDIACICARAELVGGRCGNGRRPDDYHAPRRGGGRYHMSGLRWLMEDDSSQAGQALGAYI